MKWPSEHEFAAIFSAIKDFYGRDFTGKCVRSLFTLFKPLGLALLGRSKSEVLAAIAEAKEKNQLLYDCAITTANAKHESDPQELPPLIITPELGSPNSLEQESVDSDQVVDTRSLMEIFNSDD
ncbi:hypothetical protein ACSYAD_30915 [Acaryochloris marina NIES-2412]|uniref:hypothetical protein n=1 Tax=Acaryochloris marina TaxID=155978 RepID=UPI0040599AC3